MNGTEFCGAKPAIVEGSAVHCPHAARLWDVSRNGRTEQLYRCEGHAAKLRGNGYTVKLAGPQMKSEKKKWDMTSTNSVEGGAAYLLKNSGALVVVVIRSGDAVLMLADGVDEKDVAKLLHAGLPDAYARLEQKQAEQQKKKVMQQIRSGVNPEERRSA